MKKRFLSAILVLCMLLSVAPMQIFAYPGDIFRPGGEVTETFTLDEGRLLGLKNGYINFMLYNYGYQSYLATQPTLMAEKNGLGNSEQWQMPSCEFITYNRGKEEPRGTVLLLKNASFVNRTPNGENTGIRAEYEVIAYLYGIEGVKDGYELKMNTTVYHELVRLTDNPSEKASSWGVLTTVDTIGIPDGIPDGFNRDFVCRWNYTLAGFSGMGHDEIMDRTGGPSLRMSRTTVQENGEKSVEETVVTGRVDNFTATRFIKGYSSWGDLDGIYLTEVYADGYTWATPFVGLSDYYEKSGTVYTGEDQPLRVAMSPEVSIYPNDRPRSSYVVSQDYIGAQFDKTGESEEIGNWSHYMWGYRDLAMLEEDVPTEPDKISTSFSAKRLAVFPSYDKFVVEYVADDAALEKLKKQYKASPIAQITGDYESVNGTEFVFTGGYAMLSPAVTATWDAANGGEFVVRRDGSIRQKGVHLNAPSFKFYQPKAGAEDALSIEMTKKGFSFAIDPESNDAIVFIDIPYASVMLENAEADMSGNLVFGGLVGFRTVFDGASFSMEKLGYGLKERTDRNGKKTYDFKVNGVQAKGSFDTTKLLNLELAKVEGEVNTFAGEERYAFSLELNAFDLFETEASLALERSKKGALMPDELWFYVKASPGIPMIPPVPIGQLNGGGAGFKDLVATVNGDYFAIPPIKLRGALTGTYLHLIEGTGNIVIGPSEVSLKATDVNIVGAGAATQIIDSFGYSLKLNGQERNYKGNTYKGFSFGGSKEMSLNLPSKEIDLIEVDALLELGAFGGLDSGKKNLYLAVGANGTVKGVLKTLIFGIKLHEATVNVIVGGQTVVPIRGVSVEEGFQQAFRNIDVYIGAMAESRGRIFGARAWVLIPRVIQTKFREGAGWGLEIDLAKKLGNWNWEDKGVTPVVQSENGLTPVALMADASNQAEITVTANSDETPYILLAFDQAVTEQEVKDALSVEGYTLHWCVDGEMDDTADINAVTDVMERTDGTPYRVVLLRPANGGDYRISAGSLAFAHEEAAVTPFERLNLTFDGSNVDGAVKYAEEGSKYMIRTYLAKEEGGADYLFDEQELSDLTGVHVSVPTSGVLAPSGEYYVTTYLMTERQADLNEDGVMENAMVAIDQQAFSDRISYTNTMQPPSPADVSFETAGNEVMHAAWTKVEGADGYRIKVYRQEDEGWVDTGYGYDLEKDTDSIDMALTVGGNAVEVAENGETAAAVAASNLLADQTYKIGISAYKEEDGGKYYSSETESVGVYLPKYEPLQLSLYVNDVLCTPDESGVYQSQLGAAGGTLRVTAENAEAFRVTRMDTNAEIPAAPDGYVIPDFTGTLMLKIDGISGKDVTSEYLLLSLDKEPPVLTLSSDFFYADKDSGEYEITGMADAGSAVKYEIYDEELGNVTEKTVFAGSDGTFSVRETLEEGTDQDSMMLYAVDSAENVSASKLAFITKKLTGTVTVNQSYAEDSGSGEYMENETVTVKAGTRAGYTFTGWSSENNITFADAKSAETTFVMPSGDVTVTANWKSNSSGGGSGGGGGSRLNTVTEKVVASGRNGETIPVSMSKDPNGVITVTLSDGNELVGGAYYTVRITDRKDIAQKDVTVIVKDKTGRAVQGSTDVDGMFVIRLSEHSAYLFGYDDDTFRPDNNLTRAEAAAVFARQIAARKGEEPTAASNFTDVDASQWYAPYVGYLEKYGVVAGYEDNRFCPERTISRAEFVAMTVRFYALFDTVEKNGDGEAPYTDVTREHWAYGDIVYANRVGWINGYEDGTFRSENPISRAEVVAIVNRATGRTADTANWSDLAEARNLFSDVANGDGAWYDADVVEASHPHVANIAGETETWVKQPGGNQ